MVSNKAKLETWDMAGTQASSQTQSISLTIDLEQIGHMNIETEDYLW